MLAPLSLLLALASGARAEDARVLMLGNSYTSFNELHLLVADALVQTVPSWTELHARPLTRGGTNLAEHAAQADGTYGDTEWRDALVTGEDAGSWDWVVLQDQSQIPGFPQSQSEWIDSRDGAVILDGLIEDGGGETVFLLTWGRRDGDSHNPSRFPDFLTMQEHLTEGYLAYAAACGEDGSPAWIIPAGHAFQQVYDAIAADGTEPTQGETAFTALYDADGSHPAPAGSWLAALTTAAALTGRSVAELEAPAELDQDLADTLRSAADAAVLDDPFGEIPYRWAFDWDAWEAPEDVEDTVSVVVSDTVTRPTVRLTQEVDDVGTLIIGANHGGTQGAGRLWVQDGGLLTATSLDMGAGGSELRIAGGRIDLENTGTMEADATVVLVGGTLAAAQGSFPSLRHDAGTLVLSGPATVQSDYLQPASATLDLQIASLEGPLLAIEGTGTLKGTIDVTMDDLLREEGGNVELIRADSLELGDLEATLPADTELELHHYQDGDVLVLNWLFECSDCDTGQDGAGGGEACGCSTGPRQGVLGGIWLVLLAGIRRKRSWME